MCWVWRSSGTSMAIAIAAALASVPAAAETVLEDVNLGFRHPLPLYRPAPGSVAPSTPGRVDGFPNGGTFVPYNPNPNPNQVPQQSIPGIPDNIPRYVPPPNSPNSPNPSQQVQPQTKKDVDDDDDGDN